MERCNFCNNMFGNTQMLKQHQKKTKYCLKIQEAVEAKEKNETIKLQEKAKELICQFCGNQFKTKYLLNIHQKQTKYCLKIQDSQNSGEVISSLVTCIFCGKNSSASNSLKHDLTCKKKIQFLTDEISRLKATEKATEKDQEIAILKITAEKEQEICSIYKNLAVSAHATIEDIAKQPTYQKNSTKNIQNNLMISSLTPLDLTQARVDSIIDEKYTKNDFYEGQKGAAQLIHRYLATDSDGKSQIICTDTERGKFHHIDINGDHVVDYKNVHLIDKVHLPLKRKAGKFAAEEYVKNPSALKEIIMNETSIRELETKPGLFNRTLAQLTGKNCARSLITSQQSSEELLLENTNLSIESILSYIYKYENGNIISDQEMTKITKRLFSAIKEINEQTK